ncbi:MAG TPA: cellulase family glycosylhydrolase [Polyangia bacterium]|nr:cellulase family glycosylhydrolase [Polyangia bacterium]
MVALVLVAACGSGEPPPAEPASLGARAEELLATGCPPLPPISGFVERKDGALLLDGITPFRSTGTNLYYLQQLLSYAQQEQDPQALDAVREVLDDLVCLSLPVARIWGFNDSKDTSSIRRSPAEGFREEGLRGLDQAVWEAKRRGIRLIVPLVNNWAEYGGLPAYAAWASELYGSPVSHDDFFRDAQMKQWWKDYALMLVNRVNTFTGVRYGDEPAILAWEIGNEMRCQSCAGTTALPDTVAELATFLKQIAPKQLVADGGDGFDDDADPWVGLTNYYAVRGDEGCSYSRLSRIDALDMLSYHFYPRNYGFSTPRDAEVWIQRHTEVAMVTGKVAYLGECGYVAPDVERAQSYDAWLRHLFALSGGQLGLFWQLSPAGRVNNDGYAVYSRRDNATAWILARWGKAIH